MRRLCWSLYLVKIAGADGIEALVAAMDAHKASVLVQEKACTTRRVEPGTQRRQQGQDCRSRYVKITEAGGIEALVAAAIEAQGKFPRERAKTGVCGADTPRRARLQLR